MADGGSVLGGAVKTDAAVEVAVNKGSVRRISLPICVIFMFPALILTAPIHDKGSVVGSTMLKVSSSEGVPFGVGK